MCFVTRFPCAAEALQCQIELNGWMSDYIIIISQIELIGWVCGGLDQCLGG